MEPRRCDTITLEEQKSDLICHYNALAKEIRRMLSDKYTTLNSYTAIFEKLGAARLTAIILRSDHGEPELELESDRLRTEVNEAFDAMQAKNKK